MLKLILGVILNVTISSTVFYKEAFRPQEYVSRAMLPDLPDSILPHSCFNMQYKGFRKQKEHWCQSQKSALQNHLIWIKDVDEMKRFWPMKKLSNPKSGWTPLLPSCPEAMVGAGKDSTVKGNLLWGKQGDRHSTHTSSECFSTHPTKATKAVWDQRLLPLWPASCYLLKEQTILVKLGKRKSEYNIHHNQRWSCGVCTEDSVGPQGIVGLRQLRMALRIGPCKEETWEYTWGAKGMAQ